MKKPNQRNTIDDVARHAGVSIKTVSRVLNQEPNVRPETRDKVLATAQSLGYAPNISARRLAARRSFIVALLYHDDDVNHYIPDIQHGVLDCCRERGYNLLLHPCKGSIGEAAEEIEQLAKQSLLDGFIVTPPLADSRKLLVQMSRLGVPFVRVSQSHRGEFSPSVSVGDSAGAHRMVEYLVETEAPRHRLHRRQRESGRQRRSVAGLSRGHQGIRAEGLSGAGSGTATSRSSPGSAAWRSSCPSPSVRRRSSRATTTWRPVLCWSPTVAAISVPGESEYRRFRRHLHGPNPVAAADDGPPADQEGRGDRDRHAAGQPSHR